VAHPLYADVNNWKVGDEVFYTSQWVSRVKATVVEIQFLSANILLTIELPAGDRQTVSFVNVKKISPLDRLAML
jgi:hypothetical protein